MTALLPDALRGIKTKLVCDVVTSLCLFLNAIEQMLIFEKKLLDLERKHFETLCLLEATFPLLGGYPKNSDDYPNTRDSS
jgi:hypothetical protein